MKKIPYDSNLYTKEVPVHKLRVGDTLVNDVYLRGGLLVAKAGVSLNEGQIEQLKRVAHKAVTLDVRKVYKRGVDASRKLFNEAGAGKPVVLKEVKELVQPFIDEMERESSLVRLLDKLRSKDEYTFQHTINIGILSAIIGKWLGLKGDEIHNLVLAGTLHDIGKSKIPFSLITKPGALTREEFSLMKNHTIYGAEIIEKSGGYHESVKQAVLQHHERINGEGYPYRLKGDKIHYFAKIVAVVDSYHAMTSMRVYQERVTPFVALQQLQKSINSLDTEIILVFVEKMLSTIQSCRVVLSNNMIGDVVHVDRQAMTKPLVKIRDKNLIIDLRTRNDLEIIDVIYEESDN